MNAQSGLARITDCKHPLLTILLAGLAVRLVLMPFFTFNIDMSYWLKAVNLIDSGQNLYGIDGYYYTPVWGYVMGLMNTVMHAVGLTDFGTVSGEMLPFVGLDYSITPVITSLWFNVMMKLPLILTDIVIGYLVYTFIIRLCGDERKALIGCALWTLCPLTILESSMHGMFDNISAMFLLIAVIGAYDRKYILAGASYSIAVLTKFFPVFLMFFLIALVLRNEGLNPKGLSKLAKAVVSAIVTMLIVEAPAIVSGQFWESMEFLVGRIGLGVDFMYSISGPVLYISAALFAAAVTALIYYLVCVRSDLLRERFIELNGDEREHLVRRTLLILGIVLTVAILLYSVYSVIMSGSTSLTDLFSKVGMRFVLLLSVYTLLLEVYLAYRLLFGDGSAKSVITVFMLSSVVIFLWPPSPQYAIVIIPALAVYAASVDGRMVRPFAYLGILMALYDLILAGPSMLLSLAAYTDILSVSFLVPSIEFITSYVGPVPTIAFFMAVFGVAAYLSILNILYSWYRKGRSVS